MEFDQFENKYKGERCFILGCGPSLRDTNLSLLKNEVVFACNKAFLAKSQLNLPDFQYYVICDFNVYRDIRRTHAKEFDNMDAVRFYGDNIGRKDKPVDHVVIKKTGVRLAPNAFPKSFDDGWGATGTVIFEASLVAFFMGFSEIYLLGVDFNYDDQQDTHFYKMGEREHATKNNMVNHFYYIETSSEAMVTECKKHNVVYKNLSPGFERTDLIPADTLENVIGEKNA